MSFLVFACFIQPDVVQAHSKTSAILRHKDPCLSADIGFVSDRGFFHHFTDLVKPVGH